MFTHRWMHWSVLACVAALIPLAANAEDEETIPFSKLPKAVQKAVKKACPGGKARKCEREREHGRTQYEVKLVADGREVEIEFDASGKVLEREEDIAVSQLPEGIARRAKSLVPGGKMEDACCKTKQGKTLYEVEIQQGRTRLELKLDSTGKVLRIRSRARRGRDDDEGCKRRREKEDDDD